VAFSTRYENPGPEREAVDALAGGVLLEFGTPWCGHCRMAQPKIAAALEAHPGVRHLKVEDASGRRLGRSFVVKLWPTLVFMKDGAVVETLVRPGGSAEIAAALARIDPR
jgi:thioredoxin 1